MNATEVDNITEKQKLFSICTLMTNLSEYKEMLESFRNAGFSDKNSDFLYIDNSKGNKYDAYSGVRKFLNSAKNKYIVICHQDILLDFDTCDTLLQRIKEVDNIDTNWAILGNAGHSSFNDFRLRITDPHGENRFKGPLPAKVYDLDENFLIIKNSAQLSISNNIDGFHFYATDICIIADILGFSAYVIDFHLYHKSGGNCNRSFFESKKKLIDKYTYAFRPRYMKTTCTKFFISGYAWLNKFMMQTYMYSIRKRLK
ncbi:MAG: hypothetical protein PHH41_08190 [Sulfurimonas sp.]|nr:hypothetical protein [Sulfurimonas sp.]MDD5203103.1 hypothetical protein [Sulfurimonas sp.]